MKRVFIIAAVLIAALPMAHATGIVYLFTSLASYNTVSPSVTITPYYGDTLSGTAGNYKLTGSDSGQTVTYDSYGAGESGTAPYVTNNSFLVFDFSDPLAKNSTIAIDLDKVSEGYYVYGGNTAPTSTGIGGLSVLASLTSGGPPAGGIADLSITLPAAYSYFVITATPDCELNVLSITTPNTPGITPEPGTFVMAGMALIGLGAALRKTCKR